MNAELIAKMIQKIDALEKTVNELLQRVMDLEDRQVESE